MQVFVNHDAQYAHYSEQLRHPIATTAFEIDATPVELFLVFSYWPHGRENPPHPVIARVAGRFMQCPLGYDLHDSGADFDQDYCWQELAKAIKDEPTTKRRTTQKAIREKLRAAVANNLNPQHPTN